MVLIDKRYEGAILIPVTNKGILCKDEWLSRKWIIQQLDKCIDVVVHKQKSQNKIDDKSAEINL